MPPLAFALVAACKGDPCDPELAPASRSTGGEAVFDGYDPAGCVPDALAWQAVQPVVEQRCGTCHADPPAFGAPASLLDYDALIDGVPGNRAVDRIAHRAASRTMPPPGSPELEHEELDRLVSWATCGEVHPDPRVGLEVDRPTYSADVPANLELPSFEVLADGFALEPDTLDHYQCFAMDVPVDDTRHLRRLQMVLDDARVLHHALLLLDRGGASGPPERFPCEDAPTHADDLLWAWAPGTGAFDFEEGGLPIGPDDRMILEIHYNNGAGLSDVVDRSGIRVFHGPPEGPTWDLFDAGPPDFVLPTGPSAVCDATEVFQPTRILAGMPHMHQLGSELHSWIERASGREQDLLNLTGWNFEAQQIYRLDTTVQPGDVVHTWCGFRNTTGRPVRSGVRTEDEMCFHFLYTTPL